MKTLRRILKLLPPAFAMRIWLARRYGISVKRSPWGGAAGFLLAILPYAFTAALSVRVDSDCRLLKYFMPYGRMKKFVRLAYDIRVGDDKRDSGWSGAIRSVMPYGLVLWWDAEDAATSRNTKKSAAAKCLSAAAAVSPICNPREIDREILERLDRVEALVLRVSILNSGLSNSQEVVDGAHLGDALDRV